VLYQMVMMLVALDDP